MEKSFLSFRSSYPSWEPNAQGKLFLSTLEKFREQQLQALALRPAYASSRLQQFSPNYRVLSDRNSYLSREMPVNYLGTGYQLNSMLPMDGEHPYILDWFYTSQPQQSHDLREVSSSSSGNAEEHNNDLRTSSRLTQNEVTYDENWIHHFEDRARSHLEASTSAPLFQESVLQHHELNNVAHPTTSHWWARSRPQGADAQTSFLEPPNFNCETNYYYDNLSDRSLEEQEHLDWRNSSRLSRTFLMDDDGGNFNLPFDDIYTRHSQSSRENLDPADSV